MVARSSRAILKALQKKGFRLKTGHHLRLALYIGDEYVGVNTFLSHGSKDYGDALIASMSRQLHLSKQELLEFYRLHDERR